MGESSETKHCQGSVNASVRAPRTRALSKHHVACEPPYARTLKTPRGKMRSCNTASASKLKHTHQHWMQTQPAHKNPHPRARTRTRWTARTSAFMSTSLLSFITRSRC